LKINKRVIAIGLVGIVIASTYVVGNLVGSEAVYAASQQDNLSSFKVAGDYLDISTDTLNKESLAAQLPERAHVCAVSGIYNIQIWTPRGENAQYNEYKQKENGYSCS